MKTIATNWKTVLAVLAVGLALFSASMRIGFSRSSAAATPQTAAVAPAPAQEQPMSNEIQDFPQLD